MNKLSAFAIFFGLALALPLFVTAQDPDAEVAVEAEEAEPTAEELLADAEILAEEPNADGDKPLELEDMQLWASMDLDKDGKLTVGEFERFAASPNAQNFVRQMRSQKAVETWAEKMGIDSEKAKAAMSIGANAQRRSMRQGRQRQAGGVAQRRRQALMNRNRRAAAKQQRASATEEDTSSIFTESILSCKSTTRCSRNVEPNCRSSDSTVKQQHLSHMDHADEPYARRLTR